MGWFKERLIWSDPAVVNDLTKSGLFVRIFAPQVSFTAFACAPDHPGSTVECTEPCWAPGAAP